MKRYVVRKSKYPEDNKNYFVVMISMTEHGINEQRVFKGTKQECEEEKKKLMEEKSGSDNKKRIGKTSI